MSALTKELKVRITADANGLKGALNGISDDISKVGKDFEGLKNVGSKLSSIGKTLTAGLTLPIVGIGVASTSCDMTPFVSMASRRVYGAKTALWLVKNNEKVSNVCNDVVGDIFGIISGACSAAITLELVMGMDEIWQKIVTVSISGLVSAVTIGGKAVLKNIAIKNSKEFIMFIARIIAVFNPDERHKKKNQKDKHKKQEHKEELKETKNVED